MAAALALALILGATALALRNAREAERSADDMRQVNAFLLDVLKLSDPVRHRPRVYACTGARRRRQYD